MLTRRWNGKKKQRLPPRAFLSALLRSAAVHTLWYLQAVVELARSACEGVAVA